MSRDEEQVWAELVETFHTPSGDEVRQWPAAEDVEPDRPTSDDGKVDEGDNDEGDDDDLSGERVASVPPSRPATGHDEHFVPPTPPPLPSTDMITRLAWVGVLGTPVVFLAIVLFSLSVPGIVGAVGAAAFVGGFVILIARLRGHDPYDPDDGAVV
jgi:hypothetical protein